LHRWISGRLHNRLNIAGSVLYTLT
jgi:hypothetical protein